jgi:hypothetical protein
MGNQKPGFYENTSHSPVDSGKNPVSLVGLRKFGLSDFPEVRQGINSLANSKSRLKPTKILIFSRLQTTFGLSDFPEVRQGINSLANSKSRLKPTKILIFSRLQTTFAMRQGIHSLSDCRIIELSNYRIIGLSNYRIN